MQPADCDTPAARSWFPAQLFQRDHETAEVAPGGIFIHLEFLKKTPEDFRLLVGPLLKQAHRAAVR